MNESALKKKKKKKAGKKINGTGGNVVVHVGNCKYSLISECAENVMGWSITDGSDGANTTDWNLFWTDCSVSIERVMKLQKYQKINHFPGMYQICRKGDLARSLTKMKRLFPDEYSFFPQTWVLPDDITEFKLECYKRNNVPMSGSKPDESLKDQYAQYAKLVTSSKSAAKNLKVMKKNLALKLEKRQNQDNSSSNTNNSMENSSIREQGSGSSASIRKKNDKKMNKKIDSPTARLGGFVKSPQAIKKSKKKTIKKPHTYIVKPVAKSQGKGIKLVRSWEEATSTEPIIAQKYIEDPLLIDGYKFDLRIYALITSCAPIRILLYQDGLLRMCTEQYSLPNQKNMVTSTMHLTNYAINKKSENFVYNTDAAETGNGHKRSVKWFLQYLRSMGKDEKRLWERIGDVVVKTLISIQPSLSHTYKSCMLHNSDSVGLRCFEILGFDILVDKKLTPWLIEVNHSPSFTCDSPIDKKIKEGLITNTFKLLNIQGSDKKKHKLYNQAQSQYRLYGDKVASNEMKKVLSSTINSERLFRRYKKCEEHNLGGFDLIYPQVEDRNVMNLEPDLLDDATKIRVARERIFSALLEAAEDVYMKSIWGGHSSNSVNGARLERATRSQFSNRRQVAAYGLKGCKLDKQGRIRTKHSFDRETICRASNVCLSSKAKSNSSFSRRHKSSSEDEDFAEELEENLADNAALGAKYASVMLKEDDKEDEDEASSESSSSESDDEEESNCYSNSRGVIGKNCIGYIPSEVSDRGKVSEYAISKQLSGSPTFRPKTSVSSLIPRPSPKSNTGGCRTIAAKLERKEIVFPPRANNGSSKFVAKFDSMSDDGAQYAASESIREMKYVSAKQKSGAGANHEVETRNSNTQEITNTKGSDYRNHICNRLVLSSKSPLGSNVSDRNAAIEVCE